MLTVRQGDTETLMVTELVLQFASLEIKCISSKQKKHNALYQQTAKTT